MNQNNRISAISFFGLISTIFFIIFSFLGRILFPFGDEPDFTIRAPRVLYGDHLWWSPYSIFSDLIQNLNPISNCKIEASAMSLVAHIDRLSCSENFEQILIRLSITIIIVSPILYIITFRRSFVTLMHTFNFKLNHKDWNSRLDTLSLTLLFPSIIYYLGIFAEEQFTLVISLFIFLFWKFRILIFSLVILLMSVDLGNSIIVLTFIIFGLFFTYIAEKFTIKKSLLSMLGVIIFGFIIGVSFLTIIENISFLASKSESIYNKSLTFDYKYPTILIPIITFMTGVFMTPSGVKVVLLYLIYIPLLGLLIYKLRFYKKEFFLSTEEYKMFENKYILFFSSITTILFFVFLFPDYAFAKYYVFMIPFIISISLYIFKINNIIILFLFSNIILFIHLWLYQI